MSQFLRSIGAFYASNYHRRTKTCLFCGTEFCDITKRNLKHTCTDKCRFALMSQKRHENGSYQRTERQNELTRQSCKKTYENVALKEEISRKVKAAQTPEKLKRQSDAQKLRNKLLGHWTQTIEGKMRLSVLSAGRKHTLKAKRNMSLGAQHRLRTKQETLYTFGIGGRRDDLDGKYFRSRWEANFARILNFLGKNWSYEEQTFELTEEKHYTPDFYVDDTFYELKGRCSENDKEKIRLFRERYPTLKLEIIDGTKYYKLKAQYSSKLPHWEK